MKLDQMNLVLTLDNKTSEQVENLAPHKNMYETNKPRTLTSAARFPKPVASTIANWLHSQDSDVVSNDQAAFMQSLAV
jgi:hypothetical protein